MTIFQVLENHLNLRADQVVRLQNKAAREADFAWSLSQILDGEYTYWFVYEKVVSTSSPASKSVSLTSCWRTTIVQSDTRRRPQLILLFLAFQPANTIWHHFSLCASHCVRFSLQ